MAAGQQVKNGKAFEYAIALQYHNYLSSNGIEVKWVLNKAFKKAKEFYDEFPANDQQRFDRAAFNTISTLVKIEPGLTTQGNDEDSLTIALSEDSAGEHGDVRDVIFSHADPCWEIGFSAKNNNDAVKHSRIGKDLDFGDVWLDYPCSVSYWDDIKPIFDYLENKISKGCKWSDLGAEKEGKVYIPLLEAFKDEVMRIAGCHKDVPQKLIKYLIGAKPFYKIIKDDQHNLVIVKAFNIDGGLNKPYMGNKSAYGIPKVNYPTRIVEFEFKKDSTTTLNMILDGGWEISFRIHNASTLVERSLKFDIQLLGNPPILFTQHIFQ